MRNWQEEIGLTSIGGELSPRTVLEAYGQGVFPWPLLGESGPVLWCSPDPRCVLNLDELHIGRSLRRVVARDSFLIRYDAAFDRVIGACARTRRRGQHSTWITRALIETYSRLHDLGYAHSVETYRRGELVGGLYGVGLGGVFFGESMFSYEDNASKVALVHLAERLRLQGYGLIDCQQRTPHMASFGARDLSRADFLRALERHLALPTRRGAWRDEA